MSARARATTSLGRVAHACLALLAAAQASGSPAVGLCARWSAPEVLGQLDVRQLPEASGLVVASGGERLFLHNDGDEPRVLVTDRRGTLLQQVIIEGFHPSDLEDAAAGRCGERECLFLGDIGDNALRRASVQFASIDPDAQPASPIAATVVTARYPDGPRNAEAFALHPSGDLFVVTKSGSGLSPSGPARVYRLDAQQLATGGEQTFEFRGEIPVPVLSRSLIASRRVVTAMDIAADGSRFALLTYDSVIEIGVDLTQALPGPAQWVEGGNFRASAIAPLIQAEAMAYDVDDRAILYTTESVNGSPAPLIRQACSAPDGPE